MRLEFLSRSRFILLMIGLVLAILPLLTWVDYQSGHYLAAAIDLTAFFLLVGLALSAHFLGEQQVVRYSVVVVFALAAVGSIDKLASTGNLVWFPVMPVLYVFLGGVQVGGVLAVCHYILVAIAFAVTPTVSTTLDSSTWLQATLAYLGAALLAMTYEFTQQKLARRLKNLAEYDRLTGILNRRGMEKRLTELSNFLSRHEVPVVLALVDVDNFKSVNDKLGHDVGDAVLTDTARILREAVRKSDYLSRWGGDEFLVALTHTGLEKARTVFDRVRSEVEQNCDLTMKPVTLSIGLTEWCPNEDLDVALKRADVALYEAKENGRNQIAATPTSLPGFEEAQSA